MIPTFEEFLNSYYEKNNMVLLPFGYYADRITQSSIDNNDSDDVELVKNAIHILETVKMDIIKKRKKIDNIRFWIFHFIIPFIVMFIILFNSFTPTHGIDSIEAQYFFALTYSTMITGLILLGSFIFYAKRDKRHYDLETDKTTNMLNEIYYKIDILEKSL